MARTPAVKAPKPSDDWEVRSAAQTIRDAHRIQSDPKMMAKVQQHAAAEAEAMKKVSKTKALTK